MAEEERERKWAVLRLRGLRKRWIINTILPVLVLLVLLVTLVSAGVSTFYYSSMQDGLYQQVEAMSSSFNDYFMNSYSEYNQMATQAVDTYEDKNQIELQFIGSTGRIQMSTSGLTAGSSPGTSDITNAIANQKIEPFQGRDPEGDITTLGRGGSDTTAVALAGYLRADKCQIFTDVDGVYDRDPRLYPDAIRFGRIPYDAMLELIENGAQVLHDRSVELAREYGIVVEVLSAFTGEPGTLVGDLE